MTDRPDEPRGPHSPVSILALLRSDGRSAPRVVLRSLDGLDGRDADDGDGGPDRYEIREEIGRGGVGVVYRGRDVDIGRDVAVKVLLEEHADRPELVTRFVEEAQIGGQLQHPGIVPIYELGLRDDRLPFFSMKLVKGETLAEILDARPSPDEDQSRLIAVFEKVCQTMAYAHSRGVVHRDLKPANIMVGAFGEVQVVDWGFARILAQGGIADERRARLSRESQTVIETARASEEASSSEAGRVQGTLAYMPPEQALGRIDELDERSDVFSLGAVLTEILTGKPPYTGESGSLVSEVLESRVDRAFERLDESPADAELVRIAKDCLAPVRRERPRDAGKLAERIGAYIASADERAHRAAIASAESRAQAARDRREALEQQSAAEKAEREAELARIQLGRQERSRRQTRVLVAVVLVALIAGGGGFLKFRSERLARAVEQRQILDDFAAAARGHARNAEWARAEAAAARADDLARSGDFDDATRTEVGELLARIREESRAARSAAELREREGRLMEELNRIRSGLIDDDNATHCHEEYVAAFREFGIDFEAEEVPNLVEAVKETGDPKAIAVHLDLWSLENRRAPASLELPWRKLVRVARDVDPDLWRNRLRDALAMGDAAGLAQLRESVTAAELEPSSTHLLATGLLSVDERVEAMDLLRRACRYHAGDLWLNLALAQALMDPPDPDWREALRYLSAALALKPDSARIRAYTGWALAHVGQVERAVRMIRDAVERNPTDHLLHGYLGNVLAHFARDADGALEEFREAARLGPGRAVYQIRIGRALGDRSDWLGSIQHFREAIRLGGENAPALSDLALLLARRATPEVRNADEALELALRGATLATIQAQRGRHAESGETQLRTAVAVLEQVTTLRRKSDRADALAQFALAAGRAVLGDADGARTAFEQGAAWGEANATDREYERLRREAERAMSEASPAKDR